RIRSVRILPSIADLCESPCPAATHDDHIPTRKNLHIPGLVARAVGTTMPNHSIGVIRTSAQEGHRTCCHHSNATIHIASAATPPMPHLDIGISTRTRTEQHIGRRPEQDVP